MGKIKELAEAARGWRMAAGELFIPCFELFEHQRPKYVQRGTRA